MSAINPRQHLKRTGALSLALLLSACGGTGGGRADGAAGPGDTAQPPPSGSDLSAPAPVAPVETTTGPAVVPLPVDDLQDPLLEGQQLLSGLLPEAVAQVHRFSLERDDSDRASGPLRFAHLMHSDQAVLWAIGPAPEARWYVFDPARIRLRPVTRTTTPDGRELLRIARCRADGADSLVLVYSWELDAQGRPRPQPPQQAAVLPGSTSLALLIGTGQHVAFLHRPVPGGRQRLLVAPVDGSAPPRDPVPQLGGSMRGLDRSADGVLFANDADGWYRRRSWEPVSGRVTTPSSEQVPGGSQRFLLAAGLRDGELRPVVLRLPERFSLDHLLALVAAHNPAVNRTRAIYAAALAGRGTGGWPIGYGSYWSGSSAGGTGDAQHAHPVLVASLSRGLLAMHGDGRAAEATALDRAGRLRLRIAHDALAAELNRQQAAVCEAWFQARAADALLAVDEALIEVLDRHHNALQEQRRAGTAVTAEVLAAAKALDDARRQRDQHQERAVFHRDTIRRLCQLPATQALVLHSEPYRFDQLPEQDPAHLADLALLTNPRLQAARLHLDESLADPRSDALAGQGLPLAYLQDADNTRPYWDRLLQALHLEEEAQAQRISQAVAESLDRFRAARRNWAAQQQHVAWALEQVRLARLYERYPLVEPEQKQHNRGLRAERERYYRGLAEQLRQEADLGTSFTQLWRAVGSIDGLNRHLDSIASSHIAKRFPALWIWNGSDLLLDPAATDHFIALARRYHVKQVYCHLPAEQPLADNELLAERLSIFINRCAAEHIGVWALLGEPDWLQGEGLDYFRRSVEDVVAYNRRFGPFEPRLAGIKLGLQSEQSSAWDASSLAQQEGAARLLELARQARAALPPELPLWIDAPAMLFSPANRHWAEELLGLSDGLTLLCSQREPEWILRTTASILADWPGLLEVGLELGPEQLAPEAVRDLIERLVAAHGEDDGFIGVALHDWSRLRGRDQAVTP